MHCALSMSRVVCVKHALRMLYVDNTLIANFYCVIQGGGIHVVVCFLFLILFCFLSYGSCGLFRPGTTNAGSAPGASQGTPAPTPVLPTYHRSQAALRGAAASQPSANSSGIQNMSGGINSVGPFLTSPASVVAPSPLATPHSHAPPSVPPMGILIF